MTLIIFIWLLRAIGFTSSFFLFIFIDPLCFPSYVANLDRYLSPTRRFSVVLIGCIGVVGRTLCYSFVCGCCCPCVLLMGSLIFACCVCSVSCFVIFVRCFFVLFIRRPPRATLFLFSTLFRSHFTVFSRYQGYLFCRLLLGCLP